MSLSQSVAWETPFQKRVVLAVRVCIIALGALAAWSWRHIPNPDGVSYVDISSHYLDGNWPASQSGYWSPAYPTLLAIARIVGGRDVTRAYALAHAVNFLLFVCSALAIEYLIRCVCRSLTRAGTSAPNSRFIWILLTYFMFGWTSLTWVQLQPITPDLGVAALVFVAVGLALRIADDPAHLHRWIALGGVLGLGYLTKTALLPIGLAMLATLVVVTRRARPVAGLLATAVVLLSICLPQILYASLLKGAPTMGEVARLSHAWSSARVPAPLASIGPGILPSELPSPHGPRQRLEPLEADDNHPMVYRVDEPIPGTFPLWYDASHWYRHVEVPLAIPGTLWIGLLNVARYALWFLPFLGVAVLVLLAPTRHAPTKAGSATVLLIVPATFALAIYAVSFIETRYVGPFAVLLITGLVIPESSGSVTRRLRNGFTFVAFVLCMISVTETLVHFKQRAANERRFAGWLSSAESLRRIGIQPGARVGFVGDPFTAYWAQLAGLRLVSVIPEREVPLFWNADPTVQRDALEKMRLHGASFILAHVSNAFAAQSDWEAVNNDRTLLVYRPSRPTSTRPSQ